MRHTADDTAFTQGVRWADEARSHGHAPTYYNDSECHGCAVLRGADTALAEWAHRYANLRPQPNSTRP